jgi:hypothetical protein
MSEICQRLFIDKGSIYAIIASKIRRKQALNSITSVGQALSGLDAVDSTDKKSHAASRRDLRNCFGKPTHSNGTVEKVRFSSRKDTPRL